MAMGLEDIFDKLKTSRENLVEALGENEKLYWSNLRSWFKRISTKDEFDTECRRLLPVDKSHLHNEFLFNVITKCQLLSHPTVSKDQTSGKAKKNKLKMHKIKRKFDHRFVAISTPNLDVKKTRKVSEKPPLSVTLCGKTLEIPDIKDMNARVGVVAWENGLDDFEIDISQFVVQALKIFVKNLLHSICEKRSAYQVTNGVKCSFGREAENIYLNNQPKCDDAVDDMLSINRPTYEETEQMAIERMGKYSTLLPPPKFPINAYDLLDVLMSDRNTLIPNHLLRSFFVERTIVSLHHCDNTEIAQDDIYARIQQRRNSLVDPVT